MSSITVRNLDESIKAGLRLRAARHGWSMEQEVREILKCTLEAEQPQAVSFAERIQQRFKGLDAGQIEVPPRQGARLPPDFSAS